MANLKQKSRLAISNCDLATLEKLGEDDAADRRSGCHKNVYSHVSIVRTFWGRHKHCLLSKTTLYCEFLTTLDFPGLTLFRLFGSMVRYKQYYTRRGSAWYIVREWLLWVVLEREREREREIETPVTSIDITLKSRVIMHMITSTARRPYASTRSEPVECSSACKDKELGAWAAGSSDWWMTMEKWKLCVRWSACCGPPPPPPPPQHFVGIGLASATSQLDRNAWQCVATYKSGSKQTWRRIFFAWNHIEKAQTGRTNAPAQLLLCWAAYSQVFLAFLFFSFRFRAVF